MAEFVQTMKDWQRMCGSMQGGSEKCDNCPLFKVLCQHKPNEKVDFAGAEQIIEKWVEEHPVVYPTWGEWLVEQGVVSIMTYWYVFNGEMMNQPIRADIAEKLGVEPKEAQHG